MTTDQIALRLKELCDQGQFEHALKELFSSDAVSIEPMESPEFARETKGLNAILAKGPDLLDQPIIELARPLACQESFYFGASLDELGTVPPVGVYRVSQRYLLGIARVPAIFRHADLLDCGLEAERRQRRTACVRHDQRSGANALAVFIFGIAQRNLVLYIKRNT